MLNRQNTQELANALIRCSADLAETAMSLMLASSRLRDELGDGDNRKVLKKAARTKRPNDHGLGSIPAVPKRKPVKARTDTTTTHVKDPERVRRGKLAAKKRWQARAKSTILNAK